MSKPVKIEELEVGKYYYTAEYTSKKSNKQRKSWWKVMTKDQEFVSFQVLNMLDNTPIDYHSYYHVWLQDVFYKDYQWQETTQEDFVNAIAEFKCHLNELLIHHS